MIPDSHSVQENGDGRIPTTEAVKCREDWIDAVIGAAQPGLDALAEWHEDQAAEWLRQRKRTSVDWHLCRALSKRNRREVVAGCGEKAMLALLDCPHDRSTEQSLGCGDWRVCLVCRGRRVESARRKFSEAREEFLSQHRRLAVFGPSTREKFLTLTVPHLVGTTALQRWDCLQGTWSRFLRRLKNAYTVYAYFASREIEPGADRHGHAHLHLWFVSGYVEHSVLRQMWGDSLPEAFQAVLPTRTLEEVLGAIPSHRTGGLAQARRHLTRHKRPLTHVWWPVLDIRDASRSVAVELIKYTVKDATKTELGDLQYIDPVEYAELYLATLGRRTFSTSRAFWQPLASHCPECGCCSWLTEITYWRDIMAGKVPGWWVAPRPDD